MYNSPEIIEINNSKFQLKYTYNFLQKIIISLAKRINIDYYNKEIILLVVLKGAVQFAVDLMKYIELDCSVEFIFARSYLNEMCSNGNVELKTYNFPIKDKNILIIEDIIDSGQTLNKLLDCFNAQSPNSLEIVSLFSKPMNHISKINAKYIGLEIGPEFIVGYGLDYAQKGRQYPNIYQLIE